MHESCMTMLREERRTAIGFLHATVAARYSNDSGETEIDADISVTYGKPMLQWLEGLGGSWTAWCASNSWLPKMFGDNCTLRVGPRDEGGFVKDWLYTNRNVKAPVSF